MGRPLIDTREAAAGKFYFTTTAISNKVPNPIIKLLVKQIQKAVAQSGYANVTIAIK